MNANGEIAVVELTNRDVAVDKEVDVHLGWRPDFVFALRDDGVDSLLLAKGRETTGDAAPQFAAAVTAEGDAIELQEWGFTIGGNDFFRENNAKVYFVCFRSGGRGFLQYDLQNGVATRRSVYGAGEQYQIRPESQRNYPDWLEQEA